MTEIIKESFYQDKLYQLSVTSWGEEEQKQRLNRRLNELSKNNMTQETIKNSLKNLGKTSQGSSYAFLSFIAIQKDLYSIIGIENYKHLQYIDVSHNNLITLKPLNSLKYITHLNVSHNNLNKLLDFKEIPYNLEEVISSHNQIQVIPDLSAHKYLKKLDLSHNKITQIQGLSKNDNLSVLKLAFNNIETIENLDDLNILELDLMGNQIQLIQGLKQLIYLRKLNLSCNKIVSLKGLIYLIQLRELKLSDNQIYRIKELHNLQNLVFLTDLDLCFNLIQNKRFYRYQVLQRLPGLRVLDGVICSCEEFVKAENLYGNDLEDRKRIFCEILPEEEFIDRRVNICELIEPETDSDNDLQIQIVDQYNKEGDIIHQATAKTLSSMQRTGEVAIENDTKRQSQNFEQTNNFNNNQTIYERKSKSVFEQYENLKINSRSGSLTKNQMSLKQSN
ncbi:leucine-rich repeats and guanylate kinase domain protein [Ichthyophthirius multifiliis]|uniref:Leucine-rich repeats and guanylate kinase domain protein n=1 Tax=Ichthyophthirius multifiliis TaxID=5932 RepID=G0QKN6_ICHMU|nr:leucine-rich repeats and guanylate kinase domain protein [Ichthyophthirius multifiliis]EGR34220.1 leucine-rich repeats and guanylate kinase domain protein [Ichthyophthirius multifiliis]|eukprot:XP_004039524.1 leucine-rich repeats and guanylate kinase domain protein [Ichthyophthirius multifiliis]